MEEDMYLLPEFPLREPAGFQILESDCKLNGEIMQQLRRKFHSLADSGTDLQRFLTANLHSMLSDKAASVYSWSGLQGNIAIMNFQVIHILIGKCNHTTIGHILV